MKLKKINETKTVEEKIDRNDFLHETNKNTCRVQ